MILPPVGTKVPMPIEAVAQGMKGWIVYVVPEGMLGRLRAQVTGELTEDGQIEVMIIEEIT